VNNFYDSKGGKAVSFVSPLSLLPFWNPSWWPNVKDWSEVITTKYLISKGIQFGSRTLNDISFSSITTGATVVPAAPAEAAVGTGLTLVSKAMPLTMGAAAIVDSSAHYNCFVQAHEEFFLEHF
jgi:hypothetical protein